MRIRGSIAKIGIAMVGIALGIIAVVAIATPAKTTGDAAPDTDNVIYTPMALTNTSGDEVKIVTLEYQATEETQPPEIQKRPAEREANIPAAPFQQQQRR